MQDPIKDPATRAEVVRRWKLNQAALRQIALYGQCLFVADGQGDLSIIDQGKYEITVTERVGVLNGPDISPMNKGLN